VNADRFAADAADAQLDPTAERVADFVSAQIGTPASTKSSGREFVRRLGRFRQARRIRRRFTVGVAVASALVVGGLAGLRLWGGAPGAAVLSYRVDDRDPPAGGYILASPTADALIAFSDGSMVRMTARARGRVVDVSHRGAKFALDDGKLSVDVVHRPRAQWIFEAGPFRVNVHGTSFTVAWNPGDAVFEVRLASGSISVASPVAGPEIQMHAGQTLKVSLRDQSSTLAKLETTASSEVQAMPSEPPIAPPASTPSEAPRWSHRGWMSALSESKAADVVAEAERRGLAAALERADSDDLWALANAARYRGRYALADQALGAHRRRFLSSDRSREAAFLLGRLHDGDADGPADALRWYDRYLVEAQHDGVGVSDALGRKMTLLQRWNRHTEALIVARDYLRRFPRGTYAHAARALVRSSTADQ
jgi:ferric-dicitrate binding protein FerR (iron transport regulator)